MKKHMALVGLALISFSSIQAGCISVAAAKTAQSQPAAAEVRPTVLYPDGQRDNEMAYSMAAYYLGGYNGLTSLQTATGGVVATRTVAPVAQGSPINAPMSWANGARVEMGVATPGKTGHTFDFMYSFITANNSNKTVSASTGVESFLPSYSTNNLGAYAPQNSVSSHYNMPFHQQGTAIYSRDLLTTPVFSLKALSGVHVVAVNHKLNLGYINAAADVLGLHLKETAAGAGPLAGVKASFHLGDMFVLRGTLFGSAPLAATKVSQSDELTSGSTGVATHGLNSSGSQTRQSFAGNVDIDAAWRCEFDESSLEVVVGWTAQQFVGLSRLMQASNAQATAAGTFGASNVKAGLVWLF